MTTGSSLIHIIVGLLVIGIIGALALVNFNNNNDVNYWKKYENNYYNFELKVPKNWTVKETQHTDQEPTIVFTSVDRQIKLEAISVFGEMSEYYVPFNGNEKHTPLNLGGFNSSKTFYVSRNQYIGYTLTSNEPLKQKGIFFGYAITGDLQKNDQILDKVFGTFKYTKVDQSLDEFISYNIPPGWKKEGTDFTKRIYINSPSFSPGDLESTSGTAVGIKITRRLTFGKKLEDFKQGADAKNLIIGNLNSQSFHNDKAGHRLFYNVIQNLYLWTFEVQSPSLAEESNQKSEIDSFINSIRFK